MRQVKSKSKEQIQSVESKVTVSTKLSRQDQEDQEHTLEVHKFITEPAHVRVSAGVTRSMGEGTFEFLRLDVSISMPCYKEQIDETFTKVADMVCIKLEEEQDKYFGTEDAI